MKFIFYTLTIFSFLAPSLQAVPYEELLTDRVRQKLFRFDQENEFLIEKESSIWAIFMRSFGSEKIAVRFPKDPRLQYDPKGPTFLISAEKEDISYSLTVYPSSGNDVEELYSRFAKKALENRYQLVDYSIVDEKCLDIAYKGKDRFFQERIWVSEHNVFHLLTKSHLGKASEHQYFIDSFQILA